MWSRDSRALYVHGQGGPGAGFWSVALEDGAKRLLASADDVRRRPSREEFATDDRRIYFVARDPEGNILSMDLVYTKDAD